jgi:hypothetical protein
VNVAGDPAGIVDEHGVQCATRDSARRDQPCLRRGGVRSGVPARDCAFGDGSRDLLRGRLPILRRTNARVLGVSQSAEKPESSHSSPHADAAPSSRPRPRRHLVAGHRIAVDQPHPIVQLPTVGFAAAKHPPHRHTEPSGCVSDRLYHSR